MTIDQKAIASAVDTFTKVLADYEKCAPDSEGKTDAWRQKLMANARKSLAKLAKIAAQEKK